MAAMIAGWLLLSASLASPPCSTCTNTSTHLQSSITTSHCSTILQHPSNPQLAGDEDHTHPTPSQPPSAGEKGVRNPLGGTPNEYLTDNFAIKWGVTDGFSVEDVHALGDAFEESWR